MIIKRTSNQEEIKRVLLDPSILPLISGDVEVDENTIFPTEEVIYIAGYEKEIFALSCFHPFRDGLKFHPNVLPEYRLKYGRDFVKHTAYMVKCPLYIEIPKERKRLFNLAIKIGFDSLVNNKDLSNTILMRLT